MASSTLFRTEVLNERKGSWLGPVLLAPKLSHRAIATFATLAAAGVVSLMGWGTYPRKVKVSGWVAPQGGLVQTFANQPGVITDVNVTEGAHVEKGASLLSISNELQSATLGAAGAQAATHLNARRANLVEDRRNVERLAEQQGRALEERIAALEASEKKIKIEIRLQGSRVSSASRTLTRQKKMLKEGVSSAEHVQTAEEGVTEQMARMQELERNLLTISRERMTVIADRADLPVKSQRELASVDRNIAMIDEQLADTASRREIFVPATVGGIVTSLQAKRGEHPDPKVPLVTIMPDGVKLEAQVFCSSRAVGFLKVGQRVLLRYEAFPYQKFGHYEGTVSSISRSAMNPSELPAQLAGVARSSTNEPVYRVLVSLARETVQAYGEAVPLQPGMQVDADVVLEKRRLVEWMFEPLFTVSGTWRQ
jgi:membrane fusion protein